MVRAVIILIGLIIAVPSVYFYVKLMTKDDKTKKDIRLSFLCLWGAIISIFVLYVALMSFFKEEQADLNAMYGIENQNDVTVDE